MSRVQLPEKRGCKSCVGLIDVVGALLITEGGKRGAGEARLILSNAVPRLRLMIVPSLAVQEWLGQSEFKWFP